VSSERSRSSTDAVGVALSLGAARVLDAVRAMRASNVVVAVDGRSGAGKSSLARELVARWPSSGRVQLVALDSLYPGWDGLEAGAEAARADVLHPHARGLIGVWRRWDWQASAYAEAHAVDPSLPLIVEGAGVLTKASAKLADVRVWVESPAASRRARALGRDGDTFRPHWERWARQEEEHLRRDDPRSLASVIVDVP
jgi:uridine kinase